MWLQGGPGSSSLFGLLEIHGPISAVFADGNRTTGVLNPHSWSRRAHMLYVDNPVGTGFSFADDPEGVPSVQSEVGDDLHAFLVQECNSIDILGMSPKLSLIMLLLGVSRHVKLVGLKH